MATSTQLPEPPLVLLFRHAWPVRFEDIASACDLLAATCWATEVIASRSSRYAHMVYLDVIRHEQRQTGTGAEPDVPPQPRPGEEPKRPRLFGLPTDDWHDAA
jgi:hypothetical protein